MSEDSKKTEHRSERHSSSHHIDQFHKHLDVCRQCREKPFMLCDVGVQLLVAAYKANLERQGKTVEDFMENMKKGD